ncbi:MAG: cob(I)yrinic acid a,c-diamide adenosyltransferase [Thermodesulfovibrionales bacterium]
MRKGYVQVYTGDGKGKTTAALGLALRAAGAGMRVFIAQFIKKKQCSEHRALDRFGDLVTLKQFGRGFILNRTPSEADRAEARKGISEVREAFRSKSYGLVIMDEANVAVHRGLVSVEDVLALIAEKPAAVELVITGRHAHERVFEAADLVTEMKEVKHYSSKGVKARVGIEK